MESSLPTAPQPSHVDQTDHRHLYRWDGLDIEAVLERFQEGSTGLRCELRIENLNHGAPSTLFDGNYNLSSPRGQTEIVNKLRRRTPDEAIPWEGLLDLVALRSKERYRTGEPVIDLFDTQPEAEPRFLLRPFVETHGVTVLYGDGGSLKSQLALAMGVSVATGIDVLGMRPLSVRPVLYLDWEAGFQDHAERLHALWRGLDTSLDIPYTFIQYQRQIASLSESATNVSRVVQDQGIGLVIIDSIGMARGGSPEGAAETIAFMRAARSLNVPVIAIDHITHEARKAHDLSSPFGSRYTHNLSRRTWSVEKRQEEDDDTATVFLQHWKHNNTAQSQRLAYRFTFVNQEGERGDDHLASITITPTDYVEAAADSGSLTHLGRKDQIRLALHDLGVWSSLEEIRDWLQEAGLAADKLPTDATIRTTCNRHSHLFATGPSGDYGRTTWGLKIWEHREGV